MDVFHLADFEKLKYVLHTIDTYLGFQWATALNSEKVVLSLIHYKLWPSWVYLQKQTDNGTAYVSKKMKHFVYNHKKHIIGIPNNSTGHAVLEGPNRTIMDMLKKQKVMENTPRNRLYNALLTSNFLNANEKKNNGSRETLDKIKDF